jgi:hypothetical protein
MKTIKQIKLKSGDYGRWDYRSLVNLPDIPSIASGKIDELSVTFDDGTSVLTVSNPGGSLERSVDLSSLIRTGSLESVTLTDTDASGRQGIFLKFIWTSGSGTSITYGDVSNLYTEGRGIIITRAQDTVGKVISVNTAYIEELVEAKTTESIQEYVSQAIEEARQRWEDI